MKEHPLTLRLYLELGVRVRRLREDLNITQDELAKRVDISRSSIANIERGRQHAPVHVVLSIAETLNVDMAQLLPTHAELVSLVDRSRDVPKLVNIAGQSGLMPKDVVHLIGELLTQPVKSDSNRQTHRNPSRSKRSSRGR